MPFWWNKPKLPEPRWKLRTCGGCGARDFGHPVSACFVNLRVRIEAIEARQNGESPPRYVFGHRVG